MTVRFENRTHGLRATYRAGCRCTPCRQARKDYDYLHLFDDCPTCNGRKSNRAKRCSECAGRDPNNTSTHQPIRNEPIRPIDVKTQGNPAWRPAHYPPPCEACGGFGYTRPSWSACRACRASPGHAMTFNQWTETRGA